MVIKIGHFMIVFGKRRMYGKYTGVKIGRIGLSYGKTSYGRWVKFCV